MSLEDVAATAGDLDNVIISAFDLMGTPRSRRYLRRLTQIQIRAIQKKWDTIKHLRPVYRIVITYPTDEKGTPYSRVLVDTSYRGSRPYDADVTGMWIDKVTPVQGIDKAIIEVQSLVDATDPTTLWIYEEGIALKGWLDVWLGYLPPQDVVLPLASGLRSVIPHLQEGPHVTLPYPFYAGQPTHVFTGPIVHLHRVISKSGDRLRIGAFGANFILDKIPFWPALGADQPEEDTDTTVQDYISRIIKARITFPLTPYQVSMGGAEANPGDVTAPFAMPLFYNHILKFPMTRSGSSIDPQWWFDYGFHTWYGTKRGPRFSRISPSPIQTFFGSQPRGPWFNEVKTQTLGQWLHSLTSPGLHGTYKIGVRLAPYTTASNRLIEGAGSGNTPMVCPRFYYKWDLTELYAERSVVNDFPVVGKHYLGIDIEDMSLQNEWEGQFNSFDYLLFHEGQINPVALFDPRAVPADQDTPASHMPFTPDRMMNFPMGPHPLGQPLSGDDPALRQLILDNPQEILSGSELEFAKALLSDIQLYGLSKTDDVVGLRSDQFMDDAAALRTALLYMAKRMFYYGTHGEAMIAIGDPVLCPPQGLIIKDVRVAQTLKNQTRRAITSRAGLVAGLTGLTQFVQSAPNHKSAYSVHNAYRNFRPDEVAWYVWKVRHYFGKRSGWKTKVWIAHERTGEELTRTQSVADQFQFAIHNTRSRGRNPVRGA